MKLIIIMSLVVILFTACQKMDKPVLSQVAQVQSLSKHTASIKAYDIPEGIFRGVLWPDSQNKNFVIWVVDKQKELYFEIPAPSEFSNEPEDITADWSIKMIGTPGKNITYAAEKKDKTKSIRLELPSKKRGYFFDVLKNIKGDEILVFADISENVVDKGFFGYVIIKNKT